MQLIVLLVNWSLQKLSQKLVKILLATAVLTDVNIKLTLAPTAIKNEKIMPQKIAQQILLAIVCILSGIAVGGIPETSMVSFVVIFNMAHIPLSAISILLPLDRIVDRVRTMVNIFGNTCGTLIVSKTKLD